MGRPPSGQASRAASARVRAPMALSVRPRPGHTAMAAATKKSDSITISTTAPYQLKCWAHQRPGTISPRPKTRPVAALRDHGWSSSANRSMATPRGPMGQNPNGGSEAAATSPPSAATKSEGGVVDVRSRWSALTPSSGRGDDGRRFCRRRRRPGPPRRRRRLHTARCRAGDRWPRRCRPRAAGG